MNFYPLWKVLFGLLAQEVSQCTTCRSCDQDTECQDNKTNVGALYEDEGDCSCLQ
jgi:hypothetical protein